MEYFFSSMGWLCQIPSLGVHGSYEYPYSLCLNFYATDSQRIELNSFAQPQATSGSFETVPFIIHCMSLLIGTYYPNRCNKVYKLFHCIHSQSQNKQNKSTMPYPLVQSCHRHRCCRVTICVNPTLHRYLQLLDQLFNY